MKNRHQEVEKDIIPEKQQQYSQKQEREHEAAVSPFSDPYLNPRHLPAANINLHIT